MITPVNFNRPQNSCPGQHFYISTFSRWVWPSSDAALFIFRNLLRRVHPATTKCVINSALRLYLMICACDKVTKNASIYSVCTFDKCVFWSQFETLLIFPVSFCNSQPCVRSLQGDLYWTWKQAFRSDFGWKSLARRKIILQLQFYVTAFVTSKEQNHIKFSN